MPTAANLASYTQTLNSFSGADMYVMFGNKIAGELQGVSYTITREKAPLYTMGSADPRSFSRGKRGIAGSLIFLTFDRSALLNIMRTQSQGVYLGWKHEVRQSDLATAPDRVFKGLDAEGQVGTFRSSGQAGNKLRSDKVIALPQYHDQIRPFKVVIYAANEYGHSADMTIHGVEVMNAGSGMSVDDITTDESCTFVATSIETWSHQQYVDFNGEPIVLPEEGVSTPRVHGGA
jgi:hypothetical protein